MSTRRDFFYGLGASLGAVALTDLLARESGGSALAPKTPMRPAKAKACILLFMEGGPSQVDTFDPKPKLDQLHLSESTRDKGLATGKRFFVGSPFTSRRVGGTEISMCDRLEHMADPEVARELCVYRGCQAESLNHPEALLHMNTGSRLGGDPSVGSWVSYGLGTMHRDLPSFVVMTELALPQAGATNWSSGFLPPHHQGTRFRSSGAPILDLTPPPHIRPAHQRAALDELAWLNQRHAAAHPDHRELAARLDSYELAFRMQTAIPGLVNLDDESASTREMYGLDRDETATFGRQCLTARRLVEEGVRFVQIFSGGWDSHDFLRRGHSARLASIDRPVAALIKDLKRRGLLDETLVVMTGEFGRTPDNNYRGGVTSLGRGHNVDAMNIVLAGGGVKRGAVVGATDEIGAEAVEVVHPIRDLHVTLLHQLGLDDTKLTYFHGGRYKQLSQFGGEVISDLLA